MWSYCISLFLRRVEAIPYVLRLARGPLEQVDLRIRVRNSGIVTRLFSFDSEIRFPDPAERADNIHLIIWVQDDLLTWSRLSEQNLRVDKWSLCRG
jgi:hypothetical protein